ncbi:PepSY domain-containing protein [Streptomyces sp. NPDC096310]|uniref:PepSY domain-containing protein n=1 Tax=Streptomyces sp. NPDC096310 TaxID=3366082 RepID=UPI00382230BF
MKRNFVIAAITAAALIGGGTYTAAVALSSDHGQDGKDAAPVVPVVTATPTASDGAPDDNGGDRDGRDDGAGDDSTVTPAPPMTVSPTPSATPSAPRASLSAAQAVAVALAARPGAVSSVERDDDGAAGAERWEIDLLGKDNRWVELKVDAADGSVRVDRNADTADDDDADDRAALRAATVDVRRAISAALASVPGTVTSAELDDDRGGPWEVDVRGKDGRTHELNVNSRTGAVTVGSDDDGDDD